MAIRTVDIKKGEQFVSLDGQVISGPKPSGDSELAKKQNSWGSVKSKQQRKSDISELVEALLAQQKQGIVINRK
jgi:hypothetical protein